MQKVEIIWKRNGLTLQGRDQDLIQEDGQTDQDLIEEVLLALDMETEDPQEFEVLSMGDEEEHLILGHPRQCENKHPHFPHGHKPYITVRHGELEHICNGVQGKNVLFNLLREEEGCAEEPYSLTWRRGL